MKEDCEYHIEEIADRAACWSRDMKFFKRVKTIEEINKNIIRLADCSYMRTFLVYRHKGAAKEAVRRIETCKGSIVFEKQLGDMRKDYEKDMDDHYWRKSHSTRQYGRNVADMSSWIKSEHSEEDRNAAKKQRMGLVKETRNWLYNKNRKGAI